MMNTTKLLIVEDDTTSQAMLKGVLSTFPLTIVGSGEAAIESAKEQSPDLIILDINLPGIDGYETCRQLRNMANTSTTPIIFLSSYSSLEDRLLAYGVGGNDYVNKPFDTIELQNKIAFYSKIVERQRQLDQDMESSRGILKDVQTSAAQLQSISRFIQATLFCHDIDTLYEHFFKTAHEIELGCILQMRSSSGIYTRSSDGSISSLENEILAMSSTVERIHSFGNDRALFRWGRATLLTRKVGEMIDTIAIFMDALEAGIKSIDTEFKLLQQVEDLSEQNSAARNRVADIFSMMNSDLKDEILSIGISLDMEDQDRLSDVIDKFSKNIDYELESLHNNNYNIQQLVRELRTPPRELEDLMDSASGMGDGLVLF